MREMLRVRYETTAVGAELENSPESGWRESLLRNLELILPKAPDDSITKGKNKAPSDSARIVYWLHRDVAVEPELAAVG